MHSENFDYLIIGGGIVGLSTAMQLQQRFPNKKIAVIEKEAQVAQHQTGHNSGVIHAGVYYAPGSLKADFCKRGVKATIDFCQKNSIPFDQCGKLIVATNEIELQRMQALFRRCLKNGIEASLLSKSDLKEREPIIAGLGAILVPSTGIVNYSEITKAMAQTFESASGTLMLNSEVTQLTEDSESITVNLQNQHKTHVIQTKFLVSCAGLMADRITKMLNIPTDFQIIPFRGEYYVLPEKHNRIVNHLIYPVPDPDLPFLGVHLTRMINGTVTVGPNAVLGWKREGYGKVNISVKDVADMMSFKGYWQVIKNNFKTGLEEYKSSLWKPGYLKRVQKYCPGLQLDDLQPYPAGVRAQAVLSDGSLVHDFLFAQSPRSLHVCNAPSPAATSAIPIGEYIVDKITQPDCPDKTNTTNENKNVEPA